jgi:hypothetical protein
VGTSTQTGVVIPFPATARRRVRPTAKRTGALGCLVFAIVVAMLLMQGVFYLYFLPRMDLRRQQMFFDLLSSPNLSPVPI